MTSITSSSPYLCLLLLILLMIPIHDRGLSNGHLVRTLDPPCVFNPLCTCSKPAPDLGKVTCTSAPFSVVPPSINSSAIYILILNKNGLRKIEDRSFYGTGISRLEISDNMISSLSSTSLIGLERSLRELNLRNNKLTSIPRSALDRLQRLRELNLSHNLISEIRGEIDFPLNLLSTLKFLDLSSNSLTSLDQYSFQMLASLQSLDLSSNNIFVLNQMTFHASSPIELGSVGMASSSNRTSFGPPSLEYLNLSDNRLDKIPFSTIHNLSSLKVLDLSSNIISSTSDIIDYVGRGLVLSQLHLQDNRIMILSEDAFENFAQIDQLFLSYNPIDVIEDNAFRNLQISLLDLRGCKLSKVGPYSWSGLERQLKYLDLSLNQLGSASSFNEEIFFNDSFNNLEVLTGFKMDGASLVLSPLSLLSSQYSIQDLSLKYPPNFSPSFNPVKYEMHFPSVRRLSLGRFSYGTKVTRSDLLGFGDYNLEEVDLSDSNLEEITGDAFESTPSLKMLNLSKNRIRRIDPNSFRVLGRSLSSLNINNGLRMRTFPCTILAPLNSLINLNLMNNDIDSFSRPEDCFNSLIHVQNVALDFNSLKSLSTDLFKPLSSELVSLSLSFNKITQIDSGTFNELDSLQSLDLSYNHIRKLETLSFANLRNIRSINLEGNDIEIMDVETFYYLPKMERLKLSFNRIKVFSLHHFDQVGSLSTLTLSLDHNLISGNGIDGATGEGSMTPISSSAEGGGDFLEESLPIRVNSIEVLDLSHNNLTSLNSTLLDPLRNSLTQLRLDHNQIGNITSNILTGFRHLQLLNMSRNRIELIHPDAFLDDTSLQIIDLSENRISDLLTDTFRDNVHLRVLNLNGNELRAVPENTFSANHELEAVFFSRNRLSNVPASSVRSVSSNLRILDCSFNNIHFLRNEELESTSFTRLLDLNLSHNQIKSLPETIFTDFSSLESLDLSFNPIRVVSDSLFDGVSQSLQELDMSHAFLKSIPMLNLPSLKKLDLSFNSISAPNSISLTNISSLELLDLSGNRLNIIPNNLWHHLTKLRFLSVSHNPIHVLQEDSFVGLDRLEELRMENLTRLTSIAPKVLYPVYSLKSLSIFSPPSSSLPSTFNVLTMIEDVHSLRSLTLYIQGMEIMINKRGGEQMTAKFPFKLQQIHLVGVGGLNRLRRIEEGFLSSSLSSSHSFELSITGTNITSLPGNAFPSKIRKLRLDLRNNLLSSLPDLLSSRVRKQKILLIRTSTSFFLLLPVSLPPALLVLTLFSFLFPPIFFLLPSGRKRKHRLVTNEEDLFNSSCN